MDLPIALERAYYEDIDEVLALYHACALHDELNGSSDWDEEYPTFEMVEYDLDARALYIVRREGCIIASVSVLPRSDLDDNPTDWASASSCVLARLCVKPAFQRQGMGSRVVELVCDYAAKRGCQRVRLLVSINNPGAVSMYRHRGFLSCGIRMLYGFTYLLLERAL